MGVSVGVGVIVGVSVGVSVGVGVIVGVSVGVTVGVLVGQSTPVGSEALLLLGSGSAVRAETLALLHRSSVPSHGPVPPAPVVEAEGSTSTVMDMAAVSPGSMKPRSKVSVCPTWSTGEGTALTNEVSGSSVSVTVTWFATVSAELLVTSTV